MERPRFQGARATTPWTDTCLSIQSSCHQEAKRQLPADIRLTVP